MTLSKLQPGMRVFSIGRQGVGNTTLKTTCVWPVRIVSIDSEKETVEASWNNNPARTYGKKIWSKWRATEPVLIRGSFTARLATKAEIAELKAKAK